MNPFSLLSIWSCLRFEEPDKGGAPTPPEPDPENDSDDDVKTLTQAELNRMDAVARARGKRQAEKDITEQYAEQFGMSLSEAAEIVKAHREKQDAEKSEAQKAKEAAEAEKAAAAQEKAEASRERHDVKVERELIKAGLDPQKVERIAKMVTVEVGAEPEAITEAVGEVKTDFPALFSASEGDGKVKPVDTGAGQKPKKLTPTTAMERGKERAAKYNPAKAS